MNRGELLGATLGIVAGTLPRSVLAQNPERIKAAATPIEADALLWLAQSQGYFARAGLQLDIQSLASGDATALAIVGGDIAIGSLNTMSLAVAHQNGVDMKIVASGPVFDIRRGGSQLMVRNDSPIASGSGLNGKTVAVNVLHGSAQISTSAWVDKHGGDAKSVQWVELPFAAMQAALESGRVDAAQITQPWATTALATCRSLGVPNEAIAPRFVLGTYVASSAWIAAHLDTARRIGAALKLCARWYDTDPAASTQAVATLTKQDPAAVAKSVRSFFGEAVTPALVQPVIDVGARYGILKRSFPAGEIIASL
jgi:ABC-type nitrate/sulfonate/bicarbonate transport system substrate-binding protein